MSLDEFQALVVMFTASSNPSAMHLSILGGVRKKQDLLEEVKCLLTCFHFLP